MTMAVSGEAEEGRTILVGFQIDGNGRELLDWALGKVAQPGDRVLAVHICRGSGGSSPLSLIKALDGCLEEYEGLCGLKQVALAGRVSRGNCIRRTLVKEAKLCLAATVVVGVNKGGPFGGTISVARYCAKKLPPTTSLLAVHDGKIVLEREASQPRPPGGAPKASLASVTQHHSLGMDTKAIPEEAKSETPLFGPSRTGLSLADDRRNPVVDEAAGGNPSFRKNDPGSITLLVRKLTEGTPGWPLLRKAAIPSPWPPRESDDARKMSVVQWVMNLPSRSLPSDSASDGTLSPSSHGSPSAPLGLREELEALLDRSSSNCRWFSHVDLQRCTLQLSAENLIGKGGSSRVYRGRLPDGQQVAVKMAKLTAEASRDFLSEVDIITSLQHENVVRLLGISVEDNDLVSVYSFFSRGSLEENLHGRRSKPPLPWESRFKVALGVAEALFYLHTALPRPIIHRDVKSSNILLSDDFEAQLTDFGLALWAPTASSSSTYSDVVGTFGYLAPEYFMYGKVSDKIDVYALGVVLLELVTGRKPITRDGSRGQGSIVVWVTQVLEQGEMENLLDPNLDGEYDAEQVQRMVLAASLCLRRSARLRPRMSEILKLLKGEGDVEAWIDSLGGGGGLAEGSAEQDEEVYPISSVASHISLALLDVDDATSVGSVEHAYQGSMEEYLKGRWSRSSSFD